MTTIAYRDGVMVADTRAYAGKNLHLGTKDKIHKGPEGSLIGISSTVVGMGGAVSAWALEGMPDGPEGLRRMCGLTGIDDVSFQMLVVRPNGSATYMDGHGLPTRILEDFYAIGSGEQYALGAMAHGATAEEAVRIACRLDVWSAEPLGILEHGDD